MGIMVEMDPVCWSGLKGVGSSWLWNNTSQCIWDKEMIALVLVNFSTTDSSVHSPHLFSWETFFLYIKETQTWMWFISDSSFYVLPAWNELFILCLCRQRLKILERDGSVWIWTHLRSVIIWGSWMLIALLKIFDYCCFEPEWVKLNLHVLDVNTLFIRQRESLHHSSSQTDIKS